jgi:polyhydroxyalkanoate synthesis regulator phasin
MPQPSESQIRQLWKVQGEPQGIPYPDFKQQILAQGSSIVPTSSRGPYAKMPSGGGGGGSGGEDFLGFLAEETGATIQTPKRADGSIGAAAGDGTIDYYKAESARIDKALASPTVSDARKAELRQAKTDLDEQYFGVRSGDALTTLRGAGSDADALAALQAMEGLRSTAGGGAMGGGGQQPQGGTETVPGWGTRTKQTIDPKLADGRPVYDPWDETRLREEWVNDGFQARGMSLEEYRQEVLKVNPDGNLRYTSPTAKNVSDGRPKTFSAAPSEGTGSSGGQGGYNPAVVRNKEVTRDASLGYYDNITQRALKDLGSSNKQADEEAKQILAQLAEQGQLTKQQTTQISNKLTQAAESSNAESRASTQRLTESVNRNVASNQQGFSDYQSGIAPYQHQLAGTTRQNVQFDPEGLSAQRAALQQAQGIAGGSLDYRSQAAQAYANADDVARTIEGLNMLRANATTGGNEQRRNLDMAREELQSGGREQRDILRRALREADYGGQNQQKIYDLALAELAGGGSRQREVYNRYKDISNPEMTAAERNVLAQSQRQYAIHDKANRDATARDLESRGVMSGAGQIANQQAAQQRLGEERVAGTLGAQGMAVERAFAALQGMEGTANALRAGDQSALQGAGQAADSLRAGNQAALGLAGRAATDLRTGNQNAHQLMQNAANALRAGDLAAANAYTQAAQEQRAQGFHEEYSRGVAADNASANNQSTRLGGAQLQASQSNAIRSANDAVNMFNNEQQGVTDRFNADYAQREYQRLTGLQQDTFNNRQTTIATDAGLEFGLDGATQGAIDGRFGRTNTAAQTGIGVAMNNWNNIDLPLGREQLGESRESAGRRTGEIGSRVDTATKRIDIGRTLQGDVDDALSGLGRYGI